MAARGERSRTGRGLAAPVRFPRGLGAFVAGGAMVMALVPGGCTGERRTLVAPAPATAGADRGMAQGTAWELVLDGPAAGAMNRWDGGAWAPEGARRDVALSADAATIAPTEGVWSRPERPSWYYPYRVTLPHGADQVLILRQGRDRSRWWRSWR